MQDAERKEENLAARSWLSRSRLASLLQVDIFDSIVVRDDAIEIRRRMSAPISHTTGQPSGNTLSSGNVFSRAKTHRFVM